MNRMSRRHITKTETHSRFGRSRRRAAAAGAVLSLGSALIIGAAPAHAADTGTGVYNHDGVLEIRASAGTTNNIRVELKRTGLFSFQYEVTDTGGKVVPGGDCKSINRNTTRCPVSGIKSFVIRTFDGDDRVVVKPKVPTWVSAGQGNDYLDLSSAADIAYGGAGNDTIYGWSGNDRLYGEAGDDVIDAGKGDDKVYGGDGTDKMYGGDGADFISGEAGLDWLFGDNGNDSIYGGQGPDRMYGGSGHDWMSGGAGLDVMWGGADNDKMYGDGDNDQVTGNAGDDVLVGGSGDDKIFARDNRANNDRLWGEIGKDYCTADPGDEKHTCEL
jgi:Ca2+-binding RTX toxin-like protein